MTVIYTSRCPDNTCQRCGHNSSFSMRAYGCDNCGLGAEKARTPGYVWSTARQEWVLGSKRPLFGDSE